MNKSIQFICLCNFILINLIAETSSLSDFENYKKICLQASQNKEVFDSFKKNKIYMQILEHVAYEQGLAYYELISQNKEIMDLFHEFKSNDLYGSPNQFFYKEIGKISPTTLRYIKVLMDICNQVGSLSNLDIVEIGGGYGGQCLIISKMFKFNSYTIIDLEEPLELAKKYLDSHGVKNVKFLNYLDLKKGISSEAQSDLLISNYAFTECNKEIQDLYFQKLLFPAKSGYITSNADICSQITNRGCYTTSEILGVLNSKFGSLKKLPENPLTAIDNCIIVW
jgi:putative sugar O-methyltransferase